MCTFFHFTEDASLVNLPFSTRKFKMVEGAENVW